MQFDRNGVLVKNTQPVRRLRKLTKTLTIDSRDRDPTKYVRVNGGATTSDAGDYIVYLPRVYENVTKIRLRSAIIQAPTAGWSTADMYLLVGIENLNRMDETAAGADRAGYVDNTFAKIPNDLGYPTIGATVTGADDTSTGVVTYTTATAHGLSPGQIVTISGLSNFNAGNTLVTSVPTTTTFTIASTTTGAALTAAAGMVVIPGTLYYNDHSYEENETEYNPPIGRLDRFHFTIRRHLPFSSIATTTPTTAPIVFGSSENSFTFEIEYIDNVFEDVSAFETRLDTLNCIR